MRKRLIFFLISIIIILAISPTTTGAQTTDPRFPAGTMGEPGGTVVVVSIFADDAKFTWDLDRKRDQENYVKAYEYLEIATEYLTEQIGKYGSDINFIWDWDEHEELAYNVSFKTNLGAGINSSSQGVFEADKLIKDNIDTDSLIEEFDADNIIYLFFINSDGSESNSCCSFWAGISYSDSQKDYYYNYERQGAKPEPYEFCFFFMDQTTAGVVAHEMIHSFAVPDLYGESNFGVTDEFAAYAKKIKLNDIMQGTNLNNKNKIQENITEITAYYMGLTDHSDLVEQFGFKPSTHTGEYSKAEKIPDTKFVEIPIFNPSGSLTYFDESAASSNKSTAEKPQASIFKSQLMEGKQIPVESSVLSITNEDSDEEDIFPITLDFTVKGNNALKISAVLNFDDDRMEEEVLENPIVKKNRNKVTYDGVAYGITFTVTGNKSKGNFDSNDEKILGQAFKATSDYAIMLLNFMMED